MAHVMFYRRTKMCLKLSYLSRTENIKMSAFLALMDFLFSYPKNMFYCYIVSGMHCFAE